MRCGAGIGSDLGDRGGGGDGVGDCGSAGGGVCWWR